MFPFLGSQSCILLIHYVFFLLISVRFYTAPLCCSKFRTHCIVRKSIILTDSFKRERIQRSPQIFNVTVYEDLVFESSIFKAGLRFHHSSLVFVNINDATFSLHDRFQLTAPSARYVSAANIVFGKDDRFKKGYISHADVFSPLIRLLIA